MAVGERGIESPRLRRQLGLPGGVDAAEERQLLRVEGADLEELDLLRRMSQCRHAGRLLDRATRAAAGVEHVAEHIGGRMSPVRRLGPLGARRASAPEIVAGIAGAAEDLL